jgi:putative oxidoreductase
MTATLPQRPTTTTTPAAARPSAQTRALAATRVVVSFLFVCHGLQGLFGAFGGIDGQGTAVPFGVWPYWWASVIHLVAGALVGVGLFTRTAALLCSGAMAYGYFVMHQPTGLLPIANGGEPAALYSWIFLLIAVAGPGAYALDRLRDKS